jgi:hypothetical protein
MSDDESLYEPKFSTRLTSLGASGLVKSLDTIIGIVAFFSLLYLFDGSFPKEDGVEMLSIFISVSSALFAIILTGLAIVLSFTDEAFVYAWKEIDGFDDMVTVFQFNLYLPLIVLCFSLILKFIQYNGLAMIVAIAFFAYMIVSLVDLVNFIAKYGLQRGEFIYQQLEPDNDSDEEVTTEELGMILAKLQEIEQSRETDENE